MLAAMGARQASVFHVSLTSAQKLYIDALEDSYKELDNTFEKAVYEPARKQAEAKIKEHEGLNKRTKPESYRI